MKYYKLLSQDLTSFKNTKWQIGVPITVNEVGNEMCSNRVLHCYNHPMLAVILNPIHANIKNPRLFEIEVDEICNTDGLKFASKSQTLIKEISLVKISHKQHAEFAIKVAKIVYKDKKWNKWADEWLNGTDAATDAATDADADVARATAYAAYAAARATATDAAAAYAAAVTYAAATDAAVAADAAAHAADAADAAAYAAAAAAAAYTAAVNKKEFNQKMIEIIESILAKKS